MFSQLRSYQVSYLLPFRNDSSAVEDSNHKGMFHHYGMLIGESEGAIVSQIIALGGTPVRFKLMKPRSRIFSKINQSYKEQFLRAIYFNCSAMSAAKALEAVIESDSSAIRTQLNPALAIIKRGGSFAEAIDAINAFDDSCLAILEAGERTGTLSEAINTAVEHLKSSAATFKLMIGMGIFALIEIFMAVSSLLGNRYGMLPSMSRNIPQELSPDKAERLKTMIGYAYLSNDIMIWVTIGLFFVSILGAYSYFDKDKGFRKWVDDRVQRIPALGEAIQHGAVASSFRIAASLLKGGVHFAVATGIAGKSTRVPSVIRYWAEAELRAQNGESIAATLKQPLLDNSNQLLVGAHTNSKQLSDSFFVIATRSEESAKKAAKKFGVYLFFAMAAYTMLSVCISLYVLWIQNESLMSGLKGQ